jgi:hypothetical protein
MKERRFFESRGSATMKEIKLPCCGIVVMLDEDGKGGTITSDLHDEAPEEGASREVQWNPEYHAAMDALESLVLAHAVAGIDITTAAYLEGIETAEAAIGNHFC